MEDHLARPEISPSSDRERTDALSGSLFAGVDGGGTIFDD